MARKSTVERAVRVAERCRAEKRPYVGSLREACVMSKPHLCIERRQLTRLPGVGYGTPQHYISSSDIVDLKDAVVLLSRSTFSGEILEYNDLGLLV